MPFHRCLFALAVGLPLLGCHHDPPLVCDSASPDAGANTLFVMDGQSLLTQSVSRRVAFQSLQGVVNRGAPTLFLDDDQGDHHEHDWLQYLETQKGFTGISQDELGCDLKFFSGRTKGYVLYDSSNPASISVALSVAGALDAVAVDRQDGALVKFVDQLGLAQLDDVSSRDGSWLLQSAYASKLRTDEAIELSPSLEAGARDYAVARGMIAFWDDPRQDPSFSLTESVFAHLDAGSPVYGWGYVDSKEIFEESFVGRANDAGLGWVACDSSANLSVYASIPLASPLTRLPEPALPTATNVHYVTYVLSDGDNVQAVQNHLTAPSMNLYASPDRGKVPIGWTLPPTLPSFAPPFAESIYGGATANDDFVAGPSSWAYLYPSRFLDKALLAQRANAALASAKMTSFVVLDFGADGFNDASLDPLTGSPGVKGGFYSALRGGDPPVSSVVWSNGRPVIQVDHLGFQSTAKEELSALAESLNGAPKDATTSSGYTAVYAQLWTTSTDDLVNLTAQLGPGVQVVRPDVFLDLLRRNVPH